MEKADLFRMYPSQTFYRKLPYSDQLGCHCEYLGHIVQTLKRKVHQLLELFSL